MTKTNISPIPAADKRFHIYLMSISPKMNTLVKLDFYLACL